MNIKLKDYLLEDDETAYGGTDFEGETLGDFCESIGLNLEITSLKRVNESLIECGVKPIPEKVIHFWNEEAKMKYDIDDGWWLDRSLFKSKYTEELYNEVNEYLKKGRNMVIPGLSMETIDSKGLESGFEKLQDIINDLPNDEKKSFSNKILSFISNFVGGNDLIYHASKKYNRYDIGDKMSLQELIEVGFNNINLTYYCNGELESKVGYCESDFEGLDLSTKIEIIDFYHDSDDYLCVKAKTI